VSQLAFALDRIRSQLIGFCDRPLVMTEVQARVGQIGSL
jgi:hypothetical protein